MELCNDKYSKLATTLWWFTAAPKPLKIQVFWGQPSPQGSQSHYILGDTTRPRHVTCVLVWSKSDRRRLRKTLYKQTNKQTDKQTLWKSWSLGREPILQWAGARKELLDFMVQRKINRGRHTDHPAGCHSIQTKQWLPPPSPILLQVGCPSCRPTNSVKALKAMSAMSINWQCV